MSPKEIQVACPCCDEVLLIDVLTRTILRHHPPRKTGPGGKELLEEDRWSAAKDKVRDRGDSGEDRFDQALGRERARGKDLDDLFRKAQEDVQRKRDALDGPEGEGTPS